MTASWTIEELRRLGAAHELQIASRGAGGTLSRWVPNWVVNIGGQTLVGGSDVPQATGQGHLRPPVPKGGGGAV